MFKNYCTIPNFVCKEVLNALKIANIPYKTVDPASTPEAFMIGCELNGYRFIMNTTVINTEAAQETIDSRIETAAGKDRSHFVALPVICADDAAAFFKNKGIPFTELESGMEPDNLPKKLLIDGHEYGRKMVCFATDRRADAIYEIYETHEIRPT